MTTQAWRRYLTFWRTDVEADVDEELRFHLEMREREYAAAGRQPDHAHAEALRRFGSLASVRDSCTQIGRERERRVRFRDFVATIRNDVVFATRQLVRNRGFTLAAVLTLSLGIGANGLVLSVVNAVLLRPIPGAVDPSRVVEVSGTSVSYPSYRDFRDANPALSGLAAYANRTTAVSNGKRTEVMPVDAVTGNYFRVLGVRPALGRLLTDRDGDPGAAPVAVLSPGTVARFFPGEPDVVGRSIDLNGVPVTIVGVADRDFRGIHLDSPEPIWTSVQTWMALAPTSFDGKTLERRGWSWLTMVGRLGPGATIAQARAALDISAARQEAAYPRYAEGLAKAIASSPIAPIGDGALSSVAHETTIRAAAVVTIVVMIVLLICCANVCNLLLARGMSRRREMGVRLAIGARASRIVRQLLTETVVLTVLAAAVGLALTQAGILALNQVDLVGAVSTTTLGVHVDGRVMIYMIVIAVVAGVAFGLAPALQGARSSVTDALKDSTPGAGRARSNGQRLLLIGQVAMSLTLVIGAGLFTRSLQRALAINPGIDATHVAVASVNVGLIRRDSARAGQIYDAVTKQLTSIAGIRFAGWASTLPLDEGSDSYGFSLDDYVLPPGATSELEVSDVSPQFFSAFSIPLVRGRVFTEHDGPADPHVAIINETMANRYWRGRDPVGKRVLFGGDTVTVVGVVRDIKYHELREPAQPFLYRVLDQHLQTSGLVPVNLVVRTTEDPAAALGVMQRVLHEVAPEVPVYAQSTFAERSGHTIFAQQLGASVLGVFSVLAVLITAVGIYGVVGYGVTQRTREIGIRVALGARRRSVLGLILTENARLVAAGLAIGLVLSAAATRALSSFLFGIGATDVVTYATAILLLLAIGGAAALVPALRATKIDPVIALRTE